MNFSDKELAFLNEIGHIYAVDQLEEIRYALSCGFSPEDIKKMFSPNETASQMNKVVKIAKELKERKRKESERDVYFKPSIDPTKEYYF